MRDDVTANPVHARGATCKRNSAVPFEMPTHRLQRGQRIGIGKHCLESMPGHDNQVKAPPGPVGLRSGLDPLDAFRVWFSSGHRERRGCAIRPCPAMTTFSESTTESACNATRM